MSQVSQEVLTVLSECRTSGNTLFLPERTLVRPLYLAVNKVLEGLGGKWDRKAKGHVFLDADPAELLDMVLVTGETLNFKKELQSFPTPRPVAEQMCRLAELNSECVVLEPSCGKGDLADVIYEQGVKALLGVELDPRMTIYLRDKPYPTFGSTDFLELIKIDTGHWDRIIMNPPFSKHQDITHVLAAWEVLKPGGILVSVVSEGVFFREDKKSASFRNFLYEQDAEDYPLAAGAFAESGTAVPTRIIKIVKPTEQGGPEDG